MIHTFDKKKRIKDGSMVSLIPMSKEDTKDTNVVNYLTKLSYHSLDKNATIEEIRDYISSYYNDVLSKLDPEELLRELRFTVLVSDERSDSIAIRHIVSEWLNIYCDEKVCESEILDSGRMVEVERPKIVRPLLESVIRSSKDDMMGFQTLRGLYLFEKSENLLSRIDKLENITGETLDELRQTASFLKGNAVEAESMYRFGNVYVKRFVARRKPIRR